MNAAIDHLDQRINVLTAPFLAADVGGTHARVALMRASNDEARAELLAYRKFVCAEFPGLTELLQAFVADEAQIPVRHCVLACAGQVMGDEVVHDNLAWPIQLSRLREALALDDVAILNDFEAMGYALDNQSAENRRHLCGPHIHADGPILIVGPGTGLGAAVRMPDHAGGHVLTTEVGQMDFAPHSIREREILAHLAPHGGYVPFERIVSGPGLLTMYETLCALHGKTPMFSKPEAITAAAAECSDAQAVEAVEIFCASLGGFVGNLAMAFMTAGGVYLAGGFLSSMFALLERSDFEKRFLHERSVRAFLSQVPVWVTEHGRQGVLGAARWYLGRGLSREATQAHAMTGS
ncbi:glucokinase [Rhodanobacter sp. L36]|uniref:glucokinase n=1 Tax=Rhodanobacter sp. L36 TaxID=1747221 RepID=UPI00131C473E|nr:glucokinase [Rhodanobacter sp. L36]